MNQDEDFDLERVVREPVSDGDVDISDPDLLFSPPYRNRRSPIIVEFADAREIAIVDMVKMMELGMNIMKLRTSFNTYNDRIRLMQKSQRAVKKCSDRFRVSNYPVATCGSISTCMVKSGIIEGNANEIFLKEGATIVLTNDLNFYNKCNEKLIYVDNNDMIRDFKVGWEISFGDGTVIIKTTGLIDQNSMRCVVTHAGKLGNLQTVSFRFKGQYSRRALVTKRDIVVLEFVTEYKLDMIIVYYARNAPTIQKIKEYLPRSGRTQIYGAICTQQGLDNIDDLLRECDGIVLAREFLPWELSNEFRFRLPNIQKYIAAKCQRAGKPLFISGGILSNVIENGTLTEAEISDVTNALFDGVTGFVLKEVQDLKNGIKAIKQLNEICCAVEPLTFQPSQFWRLSSEIKMPLNNAEATALAAAIAAQQTQARVIIIPTVSGRTAKTLLWLRPTALIITVSSKPRSTRYLFMHRNVIPLLYTGTSHKRWSTTLHDRIIYALDFATLRGYLGYGDMYVTLQRSDENVSYCDMVRIFSVTTIVKSEHTCPDDYESIQTQKSKHRKSIINIEDKENVMPIENVNSENIINQNVSEAEFLDHEEAAFEIQYNAH